MYVRVEISPGFLNRVWDLKLTKISGLSRALGVLFFFGVPIYNQNNLATLLNFSDLIKLSRFFGHDSDFKLVFGFGLIFSGLGRVRAWISRPVYNSDVRTKEFLQNQMHYFFIKYSDKLQANLVYFNFGVLSYCIWFKSNLSSHLLHYAEACYELTGPIFASLRPDNTASFEEMPQRWWAVGSIVSNLTGPRFKLQSYRSRNERDLLKFETFGAKCLQQQTNILFE